jgi:lysozyme
MRPLLVLTVMAMASAAAADTVDGLDVSRHQGAIDWSAVRAAGARFAFIRVGDGATIADERFADNFAAARAAGLVRSAYLYVRPEEPAADQAAVIARAVGRLGAGDLPVALDVEQVGDLDPAAVVRVLRDLVARVHTATGRAPLLYTNAATWTALGGPDLGVALWLAHWDVEDPAVPAPWTDWRFWQRTAGGAIAGVAGAVDLDRFHGSLADLETLAGIARRPKVPAGLAADGLSLSWAAVADATSYQVVVGWRRGARWVDYRRAETAAAALPVQIEVEFGSFRFTVAACNHVGCSAPSRPCSFAFKR